MMNMKRIQDAHALLESFGRAMKLIDNKNGILWYHALGMDMLLDTSFTIVPYMTCHHYFLNERTTIHKDGTSESLARFFANLLLWCIRHDIHELAQMWMKNLAMCFAIEPHCSINNTFTGLRVLEAHTIQLAFAIKDRNIDKFQHFNNEIKQFLKMMKLALKTSNCFGDRFELHKLHFELVKRFSEKRLKKLDKLLSMALKNKNYCAYDIIRHTQRSWKCELTLKMQEFWISSSSKENAVNLNKFVFVDRILPYSLPIPRSGNF